MGRLCVVGSGMWFCFILIGWCVIMIGLMFGLMFGLLCVIWVGWYELSMFCDKKL